MRCFKRRMVMVFVLALAGAQVAGAEGPSLWPFGKKDSTPAARPAVDAKSSGAPRKWPRLWPAAKQQSNAPNALQRFGAGTKKMWDGTTRMFVPAKPRPSVRPASTRRPAESPSLWRRWFGGPEEPTGPQTVKEWMAQDRLDP